jgi:cellulose synthase operon protein YhjQ
MPLILFTSPKGGVGKTTLSAHAAAILVKRGHRVLAIDLDPQNALRLHLGLSIRDDQGYAHRLDQPQSWQQAAVDTPSGVRLLAYGSSEPRRVLEMSMALMDRPEILTNPVREMLAADPALIVIVDTQPGPSAALSALSALADLVVMVLLADAGSASLIPQILSGQVYGRGTMATRMAERTAVLMNQVELDSPLSAAVLNSAVNAFGPRLLGAVCRDDALAEALADRRLLTSGTDGAAEDLTLLVDLLTARIRPQRATPAPVAAPEPHNYSALADWGLN